MKGELESLEECLSEATEYDRLARLARLKSSRKVLTLAASYWRKLAQDAAERAGADAEAVYHPVKRGWVEVSPASSPHSIALTLDDAIAALYIREINCGIETFWSGGIIVWIGDSMDGRKAQTIFSRDRMSLAAQWLVDEAARLYPRAFQ